MTEKEAIEEFKFCIEMPFGSDISNEAAEMAISALEEIKQYHLIGTVSECKKVMEKQKAKKLCLSEYIGNAITGLCPVCGSEFACVTPNEYKAKDFGYCKQCGQKLDWSDKNDE